MASMKKKLLLLILSLLIPFTYNLYAKVTERVYLQTDKQLYIAGELIWLKIYTTDTEGKLQDFSKVGYVELLSDSDPKIQIKLEIKDGVGVGWMELPAIFESGNYRLSAYTRYMRNEGEGVFFEKTIMIINPLQKSNSTESIQSVRTPVNETSPTNTTQLTVSKNLFEKRDKGIITITGLPEEYASLAVSIAGEAPFSPENNSITLWKNNLTQPIHSSIETTFSPEYEGMIISSQLMNNNTNTPSSFQNADVMLSFPGKEVQVYSGQSEGNGIYNFYTQEISGKHELTTTVFPDDDNSYRLDLLSPFSSHSSRQLPLPKLDSTWRDYLSIRNLSSQVIRAYTTDSMNHIYTTSFNGLVPFRQYVLDDYTRFQNIEEIFIEFIWPARIRKINDSRIFSVISDMNGNFSINYVLVLLDNIPIVNHELICKYNALLVERIDIYQGRHLYGGQLYGGIIHFVTHKGNYPDITFEDYTQLFDFEGTQPYRYFYSPSYERDDGHTRMPDFRHTLLWEPLINSNGGKSIAIPFYTSDIPGKYTIKVEGISTEGKIIDATLQIEVTDLSAIEPAKQ